MLAAAAKQSKQSPELMLWAALCRATNAEEQAVSTLWQGPCIPRTNESRPAATEIELPVAMYRLALSAIRVKKSVFMIPIKHPVLLLASIFRLMDAQENDA